MEKANSIEDRMQKFSDLVTNRVVKVCPECSKNCACDVVALIRAAMQLVKRCTIAELEGKHERYVLEAVVSDTSVRWTYRELSGDNWSIENQ